MTLWEALAVCLRNLTHFELSKLNNTQDSGIKVSDPTYPWVISRNCTAPCNALGFGQLLRNTASPWRKLRHH